jgi:hypothetical protein
MDVAWPALGHEFLDAAFMMNYLPVGFFFLQSSFRRIDLVVIALTSFAPRFDEDLGFPRPWSDVNGVV